MSFPRGLVGVDGIRDDQGDRGAFFAVANRSHGRDRAISLNYGCSGGWVSSVKEYTAESTEVKESIRSLFYLYYMVYFILEMT